MDSHDPPTPPQLPAAIVALVLLAAAVLIAVSCVQALLGQAPLLPLAGMAAAGASLSAASPAVLAAAAVAAVIGLVLLLSGLLPGSPTVLAVGDDGTGIDTGIERRSLDRALTHTAGRVDGVDHARVSSCSRTVTASVRTSGADSAGLRDRVGEALAERLRDLSPDRSPRVRVRVSTVRNT